MIRLLEPGMEHGFSRACTYQPVTGSNIYTLWRCYGTTAPEVQLWTVFDAKDTTPTAVFSLNGDWVEISSSPLVDPAELREFLEALGYPAYLQADLDLCQTLGVPGGKELQEYAVMVYQGNLFPGDFNRIQRDPSLPDLYRIILEGDPLFEKMAPWKVWYAHTSHLFRHKLGWATVLLDKGRAVSTAGVYHRSPVYDLIGSVSTLPKFQGRGYASLLVKDLANQILLSGKVPALYCLPGLVPFYEKIGFQVQGAVGRIQPAGAGRKG